MCHERYGKRFDIAIGLNSFDDAMPALCAVSTPDGRVRGRLCTAEFSHDNAPLIICVHGIGSNGRYFDLRTNSFALAAARRGIPTLLLDRPGYGGSAADGNGSAIDSGVEAIGALVEHIREQFSNLAYRRIVLVGHSFGGAVALSYAGSSPADTIAAICVSGLGDRASHAYLREFKRRAADSSDDLSPHWFFGPGKTFDRRGITALRPATEPQRPNEVQEVALVWPTLWPSVAEKIACPVHFRLAEYERIWETSADSLARIASQFKRAPRVDVAILPDGGHLYEAHLRGHELVAAQLDFVQQCTKMAG